MAWSDAARRAALLVRQAHARAKKNLAGKSFEELRGATTFEGHLPSWRRAASNPTVTAYNQRKDAKNRRLALRTKR